jgi:hypothetical protein
MKMLEQHIRRELAVDICTVVKCLRSQVAGQSAVMRHESANPGRVWAHLVLGAFCCTNTGKYTVL